MVEGDLLPAEVADPQAQSSRGIIVCGIASHSGPGLALLRDRDRRLQRNLFKATVTPVLEQEIGLGIVGDEEIWPAVSVVVHWNHGKRLAMTAVDSGSFGDISEFAM